MKHHVLEYLRELLPPELLLMHGVSDVTFHYFNTKAIPTGIRASIRYYFGTRCVAVEFEQLDVETLLVVAPDGRGLFTCAKTAALFILAQVA